MEYKPIPCHESLRPFIRNYWTLTAQCTASGTQQVFSNGAASLHFYLSQAVGLDEGEKRYRTVLFHQNMKKVGVRTEEGLFDIFGAEFVPFCSRLFLRPCVSSEGGEQLYCTPEELQDEEFIALSRSIHEADGTEERVRLLDDFFLKRLSGIPADDINLERLNDVFDEILAPSQPALKWEERSPNDLASTACLSQKQFTRVFNKYVGMNPKAYLRLLRFHKALQEIQTDSSKSSLTEIAWRCGYYDLAHMTNDFRDICGYSPSELASQGTTLTEAFGQQFSGLMKKKIKIENMV